MSREMQNNLSDSALTDQCKIEEWKQLEGIIRLRWEFVFKIRGWLLALLTALTVALYSGHIPISRHWFLVIIYAIIIMFLWLEQVQVIIARRAIKRKEYVEMVLRGEAEYDGPKVTTELMPTGRFGILIREILSEVKNAMVIIPTILLIIVMTLLVIGAR